MLFTDRSLWTMMHGIVLGGGAMMLLAAALFALSAMMHPAEGSHPAKDDRATAIAALLVLLAAVLWATVLSGTYVVFPPYRAAPPPGTQDLVAYPRALLLAKPDTTWLHAFAMESKEHMPWIAAMLATSAAFVSVRHRPALLVDRALRRMTVVLLGICFLLVAFSALMGTFVNKVAPLE